MDYNHLTTTELEKLLKTKKEDDFEYNQIIYELSDRDRTEKNRENKNKETSKTIADPVSLLSVLPSYLEFIELKKFAPSSGYQALDEIMGGIVPTTLVTFFANTNVGKTNFVSNIVASLLSQQKTVLYFALEPRYKILQILTTIMLDKTYKEIEEDPENLITQALSNYPNCYFYTKEDFKDINQIIEKIKELPRYDAIVIDHMGYFTNLPNADSQTSVESYVINQLASIAYNAKTCILNIVHTNKAAQGKNELSIGDIKGSSSISQDSTDIIVIERETEGVEGNIKVLKTKNGPVGAFKVNFSINSAKITQQGSRIGIKDAKMEEGDNNKFKAEEIALTALQKDALSETALKKILTLRKFSPSTINEIIKQMFIEGKIDFNGTKYVYKRSTTI